MREQKFALSLQRKSKMVDVAQLVRASDCGSEGRGFEPHLPPIFLKRDYGKVVSFLFTLHSPPRNAQHVLYEMIKVTMFGMFHLFSLSVKSRMEKAGKIMGSIEKDISMSKILLVESIQSGANLQPRGGMFCNHEEVCFATTRRKILQPRGGKNRPFFSGRVPLPTSTTKIPLSRQKSPLAKFLPSPIFSPLTGEMKNYINPLGELNQCILNTIIRLSDLNRGFYKSVKI